MRDDLCASALVGALAASCVVAASAEPILPQNDGRVHMGVSTCRGPVCHTSAERMEHIEGDEWFRWHQEDRHSQAYAVLKSPASKRIARNLGSRENPWEMRVCLDCHADHVPPDRRGPQFSLSSGVGCEACHGGSQAWVNRHDDGRPHAENVADGMYPTDEPIARAALCVSCHFGTKDKFVTHRIMGAGHPRMSFELQVFSNVQPAHFTIDDDYRARGKQAAEGTKIWAIGQAIAVRASLDALLDPKRNRDGLWPELVLFDCHACHHPMSERRWKPKPSAALLGPGVPRLNDASFLMTRYAFAAVDAAGAAAFRDDIRELHLAASDSEQRRRDVAKRMRARVDALLPKLEAWKVDASAVRGVLRGLLTDGQKGEFLDYAGAEQATLAAQALFTNLYTLGALSEKALESVAAESERMLKIVEDPENYSRDKATAAFGRLLALL